MPLDEVSFVLKHFQPKPEFLSNNEIQRFQRSGSKSRRRHGFSCIQYNCSDGRQRQQQGEGACEDGPVKNTINLSYIHDRSILLRFQIVFSSSSKNKQRQEESAISLTCVDCYSSLASPRTMDLMERTVENICRGLSSSTIDTAKKNDSLFSVISKLLQSLQELPPSLSFDKKIKAAETHCSNINNNSIKKNTNKRSENVYDAAVLDLGILMIRCAAASRRSATLCSPVPTAFRCSRGEDILAYQILALTGRMLRTRGNANTAATATTNQRSFSSSSSPPSCRSSQMTTTQQPPADSLEEEFLIHFLSLPWTVGATLTTTRLHQDPNSGIRTLCLCLDLQRALGDASPSFAKRAEMFGTLKTFHGTNPENAWSILTYGLQNLSNTPLASNGALMGKGVYLSTSYDVASFFAKSSATCINPIWWRHPSFLRLLSVPSGSFNLEECAVSCFTVFEASILAPPDGEINAKIDDGCTRRDGKYLVVPNGEDIRIKKLHLTFHIKRQRKKASTTVWVCVILVIGTVYYIIMNKL